VFVFTGLINGKKPISIDNDHISDGQMSVWCSKQKIPSKIQYRFSAASLTITDRNYRTGKFNSGRIKDGLERRATPPRTASSYTARALLYKSFRFPYII